MIPIVKNISVTDEQGNEYEATYPKRAKGLVKNGRARFVDEFRICFTCPPKQILEVQKMADTAKNILPIGQEEDIHPVNTKVALQEKYSIDYVLTQIETVQGQIEGIRNTIDNIGSISDNNIDDDRTESEVCEEVAMAKLSAMQAVFEKREDTLQKLLSFYFSLYDDLKNEKFKK